MPRDPLWRRFVRFAAEALGATVILGVVLGVSTGGWGAVIFVTTFTVVLTIFAVGCAALIVRRQLNARRRGA